jgi:hypothetical protein
MAHFHLSLPSIIANGAAKRSQWEFETVQTVGGKEVRNSLWSSPLRHFEVPMAACKVDDADLAEVRNIFVVTEGGVHTFDFYDEEEGETVKVRFDAELVVSGIEGPWVRVETLQLREVRE